MSYPRPQHGRLLTTSFLPEIPKEITDPKVREYLERLRETLVRFSVTVTDGEGAGAGAGTLVGACWLTMVAGGGGGATSAAANDAGGGGGAGEHVESLLIAVTSGASYSWSIGAGGASDTDGGDTVFGNFTARKGLKGTTAAGGSGGGAGAESPTGRLSLPESACWFAGSWGGAGSNSTTAAGTNGGGSGGYVNGGIAGQPLSSQGGGGGGAASIYGAGGAGGDGGVAGTSSATTAYGSGGGGGGGKAGGAAGGSGAGGYILICWIGGSEEFTSGSGSWTAP